MNENVAIMSNNTKALDDVSKKEIGRKIYIVFKRTIDFISALFALIIAFPIMLIICIAIKLDCKGPVIFKQVRTVKHGKTFKLYKFRIMAADNDVHDFSNKDRHTRVGMNYHNLLTFFV